MQEIGSITTNISGAQGGPQTVCITAIWPRFVQLILISLQPSLMPEDYRTFPSHDCINQFSSDVAICHHKLCLLLFPIIIGSTPLPFIKCCDIFVDIILQYSFLL